MAGQVMSVQQKRDTALELGIDTVRMAFNASTWDGSANAYEIYYNAGLHPHVNVNYGVESSGGKLIPTGANLTAHQAIVEDMLDTYKPLIVAVENEEGNPGAWDMTQFTPTRYLNLINMICNVAHARGVKVCNGGLIDNPLHNLIYTWIKNTQSTAAANSYLNSSIPPYLHTRIQNPGSNPDWDAQVAMFGQLVAGYAGSDLDYVNFHGYLPSNIAGYAPSTATEPSQYITQAAAYLRAVTGKDVICDEVGQTNLNPTLTVNIMERFRQNNFRYVWWWNGDGEGTSSYGLTTPAGVLRVTGEAFRDNL